MVAGVLLILSSINQVVYAMELGGFDVSTGVDDWADWEEDESGDIAENVPADNTGSDGNDMYEEPDIAGWDIAYGQENETWQSAETWSDSGSGSGNQAYTEESATGQADRHGNSYADNAGNHSETAEGANGTAQASQQEINRELTIEAAPPTDTPVPTPTPEPTNTPIPVLTEVPENEINKVTEFHEEYRIPPAECLRKMKLYYWKEEFSGGERMEIRLNPEAAVAVISLRINGEEKFWELADNKINIEALPEEANGRVELAIMIPVDLPWTEIKKNVILSYNVF